MSYPSFEEYWQNLQAEKAARLAAKFTTVKQAFDGLCSAEEIKLLAEVIHPGQQVLRWEKSGSAQVENTDGLPCAAAREGYSTVGHGTVYYFHRSTLKEGDTVEWDGRVWQVLMNHFASGSPYSLAYQCLYLLEVAQ